MKPRKTLRKKSLTKTIWKKAFRDCERALIAAVNRRDKDCQLCHGAEGDPVLQMDHAIIRRGHLAMFFEIRQMVLLCKTCHCNKTNDNFGAVYRVIEIVRRREGREFVNRITDPLIYKPAKKWSYLELENMTEEFKGMFL